MLKACDPRSAPVNGSPDPIAKQILIVAISEGRETDPLRNPDLPPPLFRQRATLMKGAAGQTFPVRQPDCTGGKGKLIFFEPDLNLFRRTGIFCWASSYHCDLYGGPLTNLT